MMSAMKTVTAAGVALIAALGAARAADVQVLPSAYPARSNAAPVVTPGLFDAPPAYPVVRVYDWTGFYAGINGGGVFGRTQWNSINESVGGNADLASGLVGGTAGYNLQTGEPYVFGIEADIDWTDMKATVASPSVCLPGCEFKVPWLATARLRFGYAFDRILPYVTGGAVIGDLNADIVGKPFGTDATTNLGWTAGAGVEFALTDALRAKIEYLHIDLNGFNCNVACAGNPVSFTVNGNIIRAGLNYRFWTH